MDPLATTTQLAARLKVTVGDLDAGAAELALANASGLVRAVARQDFTYMADDTVILDGGERILTLPQRPVVVDGTRLLTVVELGDYDGVDVTLVEGVDFTRLGEELTRAHPWRWSTRLQGWPWNRTLGVWAPRVRVTYSHGYEVIPDDIVGIVLDAAVSLYNNPGGLRSWSVPEYSETYATELLGAATAESLKQRLSAMGRRRGAFSI